MSRIHDSIESIAPLDARTCRAGDGKSRIQPGVLRDRIFALNAVRSNAAIPVDVVLRRIDSTDRELARSSDQLEHLARISVGPEHARHKRVNLAIRAFAKPF